MACSKGLWVLKHSELRTPNPLPIIPQKCSVFALVQVQNKSMTQNRQGIDELMAAERQAADIIATARLLKKQRRTQADQDALTEIDAYKEKKTQEFDVVKTKGEGGQDESLQALAADAKQVCERLDNEFKANKDKTTDMLVKYVTNGLL